jgi:dihydrofolate synthase/folylpolyglutamate synthase
MVYPSTRNSQLTTRLAAALDYLDGLPDFERGTAGAGRGYGLDRMRRLLAELDHPERAVRIAHIAGTKGKGSTAAMLAAMLRAAGRRTGLYTSPHLVSFRERIVVDGAPIGDDDLGRLVLDVVRPAAARVEQALKEAPLHFEQVLGLALVYFCEQGVQDAVLEVGLGGRLDATNAVDETAVSVIITIGYDHMQVLGHRLEEIAAEKAAIIRPGGLVVCAPQQPAALAVVRARCREQHATLTLAGVPATRPGDGDDPVPNLDWTAMIAESTLAGLRLTLRGPGVVYDDVRVALAGRHQATNAAVAVAALHALWQQEPSRLMGEGAAALPPRESIYAGLTGVVWPGRLQVFDRAPLVVLDGAHNRESAEVLAEALAELLPPAAPLTLVLGISRDKELVRVAAPLLGGLLAGRTRHVLVTRASHARAAPPEEVAAAVLTAGGPAPEIAEDPPAALALAHALTPSDGVIVVTGSLHVVGDLLR